MEKRYEVLVAVDKDTLKYPYDAFSDFSITKEEISMLPDIKIPMSLE